jgi:hypothetical protein
MTVVTLLPVTIVFALLQRHITTGIAPRGPGSYASLRTPRREAIRRDNNDPRRATDVINGGGSPPVGPLAGQVDALRAISGLKPSEGDVGSTRSGERRLAGDRGLAMVFQSCTVSA